MAQQTIVITGASDGIGAAAARQLAGKDTRVVLVGRSPAKTKAVAEQIDAPFHVADYADLEQVRKLAAELTAAYPHIDVLANNAGGIMGDRQVTTDGFEKTLQVNHLAPFLLTHLLLPTLTASNAKVIQTASEAARMYGSSFDIDDLQNEQAYSPTSAYGNAKLANILFTKELDRRYRDQGIAAAAFHPGVVATNFASDTTHFMRFVYHTPVIRSLFTINADKGAETLVWLAGGNPGAAWRTGEFYEKKAPVEKVNPKMNDAALARELWERSATALGI